MSLYRQVKTLFTLSSLIFTYIIWTIASFVIFNNTANYMAYIISLGLVFLMQYLRAKEKKPIFQLLIPFIIAIAINFLVFNVYSAECNSLYIVFILVIFSKFENEEINYEIYRTRIKKSLYTLMVIGAMLPLINKGLAQSVLRFYLVYLISAVIVLREARKFASRINNKNSVFVNLTIIFSVILLSMDKIYSFIIMIFSYIWLGISFLLVKITMVIAYVLIYLMTKPLNIIIKLFEKLILKASGKKIDVGFKMSDKLPDTTKPLEQNASANLFIFMLILKIIVVLVILFIIYKIFDDYARESSYEEEGQVHKEKIFREKKIKLNKEGRLSKFISFFKGEVDVRTRILNVYLKFEQKMRDKEIYKPHMTAGQLSNVAKTQIDDIEAINSITNIYNEAKFSNHKISEKNAQIAKSSYESLRKKI